ncbi:MAG: efflux RND transporter periplasmic adaptor subunit [Shewanella sp.]|nr:efflux RND transporter periplasmic adaptor subunit [Shewanella sp.]MCF1431219.1 efflux RND transporter periplasmic adaptor subunit [Shewanella sp.]MCF1440058.1 efflux RND transporter periplasmic adaptor subunit [Shewanella sp.]MCF1459457.1 efflux RND transporter periplasmic adaptor subunit [Shewanella sp.]
MLMTFLRRSLPPLLILMVFIALAALLMATKEEPEKKEEKIQLPLVDARYVQQQQVSLNLPSYGVVKPKHKTQLVGEVAGRVLTIAPEFVAGGIVKKGQQLAVIEPSDYEAELAQAQASLAQAQAALNEEQARGEVAKIEFQGFDKGVPPELGLRKPQLKKEQANVKFAQAAVDRALRNLERTVIRAPFDGIVKSRNVDLGQYVTLGTNLGELYNTDIAEIRLPLTNSNLAYLESVDNPDTQVILTAKLAGRDITWEGHIVRSEGVIDASNRMVYLVAEVKDPYLHQNRTARELPLKFGTFVNAVIRGRTVDGIVKLPRHLVRDGEVALVTPDNTIDMRKVNVVRSDIEHVYIKDSILDGEKVSYTPINTLSPGQTVRLLGELAAAEAQE